MELIIPWKSYSKMVRYTRAVEGEISGLADIDWDKQHKNLVVGKVHLLKQKGTSGSVELFEKAVHEFMLKLIKKGATRTPRLWWHSHYNFDPFFSPTDEATLKRLKTDTFIVAVCVNQEGKMEAKAIISSPKEKVIDPFPIKFPIDPLDPTEEIKKEVAQKVTIEKFSYPFPKKKYFGNVLNKLKEDNQEHGRCVLLLPFKVKAAMKTIEGKNLIKSFDPHFHEWVLEDPITKTIYRAQQGSIVKLWLEGNDDEPRILQ